MIESIRRNRFGLVLIGAYLILLALGLSRHQMWGDELQAWLIARDSASLRELFANLRYEAHPALFYLLLKPLTLATRDPRAMQILNFAVMACTMALILLRGPFNALEKLLLPFGYVLLYEYGVKTRSYGLGLLLVVLVCMAWNWRRERPAALALLLALLANVHILFLFIALAFCAVIAVELYLDWRQGWRQEWRQERRQERDEEKCNPVFRPHPALIATERAFTRRELAGYALAIAIFSSGVVLALATLIPAADVGLGVGWHFTLAAERSLPTFISLGGLLGRHHVEREAVIAAVLLAATLARFRRSPLPALFLALSLAALIAFFQVKYAGYIWHFSLYFVVLLIATWLDRAYYNKDETGSQQLVPAFVLVPVLIFQIFAGKAEFILDLRTPLSNAGLVAAFLQKSGWADDPIAGFDDFGVSTIAGYLPNGHIYYGNGSRWGSFVRWDMSRLTPVDEESFLRYAEQLGPAVTLVTERPMDPALLASHGFHEVRRFTGARMPSENFIIYRRGA